MNAPAAHAFAAAAEATQPDYEPLAKQLIDGVGTLGRLIRGDAPGVANIVSFVFPGSAGDSMLFLLDQQNIEVSNGSACTAGVTRASHVLLAMGMSEADAASALRFSFGPTTTQAEIAQVLAVLPQVVATARKI
jgi:cysteine desulfurase